MENHFKNDEISDILSEKIFPGVAPHTYECEKRKKVEYILSPKNQPERGVVPFLLKLKDEDEYLLFKGVQTLKLSSEESYDKITNRNIIRYIVRDHNISLDDTLLRIYDSEDRKKIIEYGNLTD